MKVLTKTFIKDVLSRTIKSLRDLRDQWMDADLTVLNLISQLTALRAALNKISEWISSDLSKSSQHYQLIMDLEDSMSCCRVLVKSMDDYVSRIDWKAMNGSSGHSLDTRSRIRVILEDKNVADFQKYVERQTNALTVLLTACNW